MVNRYGAMARSHWARWLPQQCAAISDPDSFFSKIGQEAARQIDELTTELAGDSQPGEDYLARAGRLTAARIQAEEIIKSREVINEILAKHSGQPLERVAKDTERDRYLTALQAKEYGLVDEVVGRIGGTEKGDKSANAPPVS